MKTLVISVAFLVSLGLAACSREEQKPSTQGGAAAHDDSTLKKDGGWCDKCNMGWMPGGTPTSCKDCATKKSPCDKHPTGAPAPDMATFACG